MALLAALRRSIDVHAGPRVRLRLLVLAVALGIGCARPQTASEPGVRSSDIIYIDELQKANSANMYDAVRRLRPQFLRSRGQTSILIKTDQAPVVYLDNRRYGDLESLRTLTIDGVFQVRFFTANQAQQRWGMNHAAGVIHVVSMSGRAVPQQ